MRTRPNNYGGARFSNMDLSGADFSNADLRNADLCDSDLVGADLRGTMLRGANIDGANLFFAQRGEHDHPIMGWCVVFGLLVLDCHRRNGDPATDSLIGKEPYELAQIYRDGGPLAPEAMSLLVTDQNIQKIITKAANDIARRAASATDAKALADDYAQEAVLHLITKLKDQDADIRLNKKDFFGFVKTTVWNILRNKARSGSRYRSRYMSSEIETTEVGEDFSPSAGQMAADRAATETFEEDVERAERAAEQASRAEIVTKALRVLEDSNKDFADVLALDLLGLSDQEIAERTGAPIATVRTRRLRGQERLNEIIRREQARQAADAVEARIAPRRRAVYAPRESRTL